MKTTKNINELTPIETALQQQFKPDANSVRAAFQIVENNRAEFSINAMKFGFCALAAKAIIGYGKFGDWLKAALSENGNERIMAYSTACDYIGYAKVFIRKLENPEKIAGSLADGVREFCAAFKISEIADFKIDEVLQNSEKTTILLEETVGKMSRKQMQQLFREGAEQAYTDEQQRKTALTKSDLRGLKGGDTAKNPQMLLWEDWTNELGNLDKLIKHKDIIRLPKDKLQLLERAVEDRLNEIRKLIENCGE